MTHMRLLQETIRGGGRFRRYEKLTADWENEDEDKDGEENVGAAGGGIAIRTSGRRYCWVRKANGGVKGIRLWRSRTRKLTFKAFPAVVSKIVLKKLYIDFIHRIRLLDSSNFNVVFSTNWGLPVLSHHHIHDLASTLKCKRSPNIY